ncbi:hypothetical protein LF41_78 [Lysobacter dokdonensis DS-58]|uniref:Uncharacterized protein n=1 Tax=Lysobacter dokdonensis DS-58 TaxID=1300345 RepID=A0A0A2WGT4_9GAMM|nr:hypothetical protein LF41_78 [Lysobacter dokdonensis DS-58]
MAAIALRARATGRTPAASIDRSRATPLATSVRFSPSAHQAGILREVTMTYGAWR